MCVCGVNTEEREGGGGKGVRVREGETEFRYMQVSMATQAHQVEHVIGSDMCQ